VLESDTKTDPRFSQTADQLKAKGITDFQLHYALQTIERLGKTQTAAATGARKGSK
jgi:carboxyl-terminal processing protease